MAFADTWMRPQWPAPPRVKAISTTRHRGVSSAPFDSLNFGDHVGDDPARVAQNRALLRAELGLAREPMWLTQVHGTHVARGESCEADAAYTAEAQQICVIMTADCLPVLLCDRAGRGVAAAHAGWRGLLNGVIEKAVDALQCDGNDVLAWMGPAIGPDHFEVGDEVCQAYREARPESVTAFRAARAGHWYADIFELGRQALARRGVTAVYGGGICTYSDPARFFSFRRDGRTGRMASLIWLAD